MSRTSVAALRRALLCVFAPTALLAACRPLPASSGGGAGPDAAPLVTEGERSGFQRTGRFAEVQSLCRGFEQTYPDRARCVSFGTTPEGRPMLAIVASDDGVLDPVGARAKQRPVVMFQGGIHAGEIDGKDGGLLALRELLDGALAPRALSRVTAVFVPVFNVDGHERFGANHRPNQRGPEAMGFRTTAQNLNLNRDYVKAEAPEMRAMLAFVEAWDPAVYVDLHTTDGAKFQHDIAVLVEPSEPRKTPEELGRAARSLSGALMASLTAQGHLPLPFYPSFVEVDEPTSGISTEPGPPRFSQRYMAARNRIGILVETHSWATHPRRVRAVRDLLGALFERAASDAPTWRAAEAAADAAAARLAGAPVPLTWRANEASRIIEFRGYAYEKRPSEISGGTWTVYDESRAEIWRTPLFDHLEPDLVVTAPRSGYVVPAAHAAWVAEKLRLHGVRYEVVPAAKPGFAVEAFRADEVDFGRVYEGRMPVRVKGAWRPERRDIPKGSLFVPIAQSRALVLLHLFEPLAPDSLVSWGFFNASFERKEYMENYVVEEEARKMLAADPALRAEFDARLKDPAFAGDSAARLDFFYKRHPAWDERLNLVPLLRVDAPPLATAR